MFLGIYWPRKGTLLVDAVDDLTVAAIGRGLKLLTLVLLLVLLILLMSGCELAARIILS